MKLPLELLALMVLAVLVLVAMLVTVLWMEWHYRQLRRECAKRGAQPDSTARRQMRTVRVLLGLSAAACVAALAFVALLWG